MWNQKKKERKEKQRINQSINQPTNQSLINQYSISINNNTITIYNYLIIHTYTHHEENKTNIYVTTKVKSNNKQTTWP